MKQANILFLTPYPYDWAPSQRFRFEQYFKILNENNLSYTQLSFYNQLDYQIIYKKGYLPSKLVRTIMAFLRRFLILAKAKKYDFIFIHREITPIGPPFFEWVLAKIYKKNIVYDFDDAIWLKDSKEKKSLLARLKWKSKVSSIISWSKTVSAGNEYLANYAKQFNQNVIINPTTIDCENLHNPAHFKINKEKDVIVIGWTGTHSTMVYLEKIYPLIRTLEKTYPIEFVVISNEKPNFFLKSLKYVEWSKESEISDLMQLDIGLMPLTDDEWSKGKCGFKILQYMALRIPCLASPVGVNSQIINSGENGFLCYTDDDWKRYLVQLIDNEKLRKEIGDQGISTVISSYSVTSNSDNFLSLFAESKIKTNALK